MDLEKLEAAKRTLYQWRMDVLQEHVAAALAIWEVNSTNTTRSWDLLVKMYCDLYMSDSMPITDEDLSFYALMSPSRHEWIDSVLGHSHPTERGKCLHAIGRDFILAMASARVAHESVK